MYFDRLGEQQVVKRRRPSPLRNKPQPAREAAFSQEIRRRKAAGRPASGITGFGKIGRAVFDGLTGRVTPGNMEKPRKRKSPVARRPEPEAPTGVILRPSASTGTATYGTAVNPSLFAGIRLLRVTGLSSAWLKRIAAALTVLALGVVGLNWGATPSAQNARADISPASLEDPVTPLALRAGALAQTLPPVPPPVPHLPYAAQVPLPVTAAPVVQTLQPVPQVFGWIPHVVAPGDTVSGIAARHGVLQGSVIALNGITEAWALRAGTTLRIPNMDGVPHTVVVGDTLEGIANAGGIPLEALLDANNISGHIITAGQVLFVPGARMNPAELTRALNRPPPAPAPVTAVQPAAQPRVQPVIPAPQPVIPAPQPVTAMPPAQRAMIRPVSGAVTSPFGWREDPGVPGSGRMQFNQGVDIAGAQGEPVMAAKAGTVMHRGSNPQFGNFIVLQHGEYQTVYGHLSSFTVGDGETVTQGQEIGRVGSTGRIAGPHLHFGVFHRGEPVNPVDRWR